MYNDYPTAGYNSNVDQFVFLKIGVIVLLIGVFVLFLISYMRVFKKANRNPITALIPFYNIFPLLEICNLPKMYFVFLIIPGVNLIYYYQVTQVLAKLFKRQKTFGIGLFILPFVYYPILAFSKSEYVGINIVDMESKNQVSEIKEIDEHKNQEIVVEENVEEDISSRNINISLGGGKYQKEYASNLGSVEDQDKVIAQRNVQVKQQAQIIENPTFIQMPVEDEPKEIDLSKTNNNPNDLFNVSFIETETKEENTPEIDTFSEFFDCPYCGTKLKQGTKSCFICGNKIG